MVEGQGLAQPIKFGAILAWFRLASTLPRVGVFGEVGISTWATSPARTSARPAGSSRLYTSAVADRAPLDRLRHSPSARRKGAMARSAERISVRG